MVHFIRVGQRLQTCIETGDRSIPGHTHLGFTNDACSWITYEKIFVLNLSNGAYSFESNHQKYFEFFFCGENLKTVVQCIDNSNNSYAIVSIIRSVAKNEKLVFSFFFFKTILFYIVSMK